MTDTTTAEEWPNTHTLSKYEAAAIRPRLNPNCVIREIRGFERAASTPEQSAAPPRILHSKNAIWGAASLYPGVHRSSPVTTAKVPKLN